ncbi:hypothetical protein HY449_03550 [Candidatus Pacearchaeota archaeon]|nr:hypothetical protein [Candidatus Pacearchaeota archaeon]
MITERYIGQRGVIVENYENYHTSEGGLKVLESLGLEITAEEKSAFLANWSRYYARAGRHFLSAASALYSRLPQNIEESVRKNREDEFYKRINSANLLWWMRE